MRGWIFSRPQARGVPGSATQSAQMSRSETTLPVFSDETGLPASQREHSSSSELDFSSMVSPVDIEEHSIRWGCTQV